MAIPKNIMLLEKMEFIDLVAVVKINAAGSLENQKLLFIKGFGLRQAGKMGAVLLFNKMLNIVDALFYFKLGLLKSLKSASVACDSSYKVFKDPNDQHSIDWLLSQKPDLIISFSAPCVFKKDLLALPRYGCINLHCSLLPKYAGLLPSFWALHEKANMFGATVHKMDDKIDNGAILGQVEVAMSSNPSMFDVIRDTKLAGGHLMVSVVKDIVDDNVQIWPNQVNSDDYYSWPTADEIRKFRRGGGRLI